ncbi:uncharacterized protein LOC116261501 isoform X2 [Nymphaea colorata]|uniref:uncharacterized protein LOC116261501 isoform X2 n=1 Tax=Nymphaea colorata TaxID=210225 RepID=UPI00129D2398|nr:uncharacterized protein LOC116261501 isoform X2 [Nymphaea colorata]
MEDRRGGVLRSLKKQRPSIRSLFRSGQNPANSAAIPSDQCIPQLSQIANSVVARCSRVLLIQPEQLQRQFESQMPEDVRQPSCYARNLLEYCSYSALHLMVQEPDHLSDREFRRLSYDMMLAWEAPAAGCETLSKVDDKKTVGLEAFTRIAPAAPSIADIIAVDNLFAALTSSSGGQLHFLIYEKYLIALDKVIRTARSFGGSAMISNLQLAAGEIAIEVDGTIPTQPVFQHIGISAWPGRLILTNRSLYFESVGVGSFNKATIYDLSSDSKQIVKRECTGPLGAKLFDKAVSYKSMSLPEPVSMEFPEFKGHLRRDYWLAIIREVLHVNQFIRKFSLTDVREGEALSRAILGIFRCRAIRDAFHTVPAHFRTILSFSLAEKLPKGDNILEALSGRLEMLNIESGGSSLNGSKINSTTIQPVSLLTLQKFGLIIMKETEVIKDVKFSNGDVWVGDVNPLELALKQSKLDSSKAEAAHASVTQMKVEGVDTNLAVMKELLSPLMEVATWVQLLASWESSVKSSIFLMIFCYAIFRDWFKYILPYSFLFLAVLMLWHKHQAKGKPVEVLKVIQPPNRNPVEQLLVLQEVMGQLETYIQAANIILLKLRALLFSAFPQATNTAALFLIFMAVVLVFMPLKYLIMCLFLEPFTREMPLRKETSDKVLRRLKEWWIRIPAAPVQIIKPDESKKRR